MPFHIYFLQFLRTGWVVTLIKLELHVNRQYLQHLGYIGVYLALLFSLIVTEPKCLILMIGQKFCVFIILYQQSPGVILKDIARDSKPQIVDVIISNYHKIKMTGVIYCTMQ